MLERKIVNDLIAWKNNPDKLCLMVKGARQVGKSTIIMEFCKTNYRYYAEMNFVANEGYTEIFAGSLEKENVLKQITLYFPDMQFIPNETVIFLDEIQDCPRAITALKFLARDKRFDVIASGSLLGITYKRSRENQPSSVPVGYVEHLEMHSLDFEEFLWANKIPVETIREIKTFFVDKSPVLPAMHTKMLELFREYIVVGGMPNVVQDFVNNRNFGNVLKLQRDILQEYKEDISQYAEGMGKSKVRACFLSIPNQLAKKYKKFQWNVVEKNSSSRKYKDSVIWLIDAGIVSKSDNLSVPELPLAGNVIEGEFKIYMRDTGLLVAMLEDGSQKNIINGDLGIYKGAIYENIIADIFRKSGKQLFYYARDNRFEIDFVVRIDDMATVIEVKAGDNTKAKSVDIMVNRHGMARAVKLASKNVGVDGKIETLPLYMAMFL